MALTALLAGACTDSNYDLSNIDGTVGFSVEDLTVPINIDEVKLDGILDIEEGSILKKSTSDGSYYLLKEGTFGPSDKISIKKFTVKSPTIEKLENTLTLTLMTNAVKTRAAENGTLLAYYALEANSKDIKTHADNVDDHIDGIDSVSTEASFTIDFLAKLGTSCIHSAHFEDVKLKMPKGVDITPSAAVKNWDKENGILELNTIDLTASSNQTMHTTIDLDITGIDMQGNDEFLFAGHRFDVISNCQVLDGRLAIYSSDINLNDLALVPQNIDFILTPTLSDILVTECTGMAHYGIESLNVDPVEVNDIPDVLSQSGTKLGLANPQLYLSLNNPVHQYGLTAHARLSIQAEKNKEKGIETESSPMTICDPVNYFVLSPKNPEKPYQYDNPEWVSFNTVNILDCNGKGIPDKLYINVLDPEVPQQQFTKFPLGQDLEPVQGNYYFYAPVELTENSVIHYGKTFDDWNKDGDLDKLYINKLTVRFNVTTDVPYELNVVIKPVEKISGKTLERDIIATAMVPANAQGDEIVMTIEAPENDPIVSLDGITLTADAAAKTEKPLSPDMNIKFSNVKATVTGMYIDEDDK